MRFLYRLEISILFGDVLDARTGLQGVEVMMAYYHGTGVAPVQVFQQLSHGCLLRLSTCIGGLTADVEPTLGADA